VSFTYVSLKLVGRERKRNLDYNADIYSGYTIDMDIASYTIKIDIDNDYSIAMDTANCTAIRPTIL